MPSGPLHRHLARQLRKAGANAAEPPSPEAWNALLQGVSKTYEDTDRERYTLERSVMLASEEMVALNSRLESERDHLRLVFEQAPTGMIRTEIDGRITMVNPALERMLGYAAAEMLGQDTLAFVHPDERPSAAETVRTLRSGTAGPTYTTQRRFVHKAGTIVLANKAVSLVTDAAGKPLFTVAIIEDISERAHLEAELRQAQKLESVGRLAAGLAHEINTPIQYVGDNAEFVRVGFLDLLTLCGTYRDVFDRVAAKVSTEDRDTIAAAIELADFDYLRENAAGAFSAMMEGISRVSRIVKAMKAFARADQLDKLPADINEAIRCTLAVGASEIRFVADVETDLSPVPMVECRVGELNQVFLNLFVNAAHAIADAVGNTNARGTITVKTYVDSGVLVVAVSDTGTGIPEAVRNRIFDPFFTTKEVGRGSGQGLAISRSVVEHHGGTLTFETEVGRGTTFWVRLPLSGPAQQRAVKAA